MIQQISQIDATQNGQNVLIVEDNEDGLFMLRTLLQLKGYSVTEARDGLEAVQIATEERPDLILMDLQLPHLDGIAVTRHLRHHPNSQYIPIVIVTGRDPKKHRAAAMAAGCDDYVFKPFDLNLMDESLDRYVPVDLRRPSGELLKPTNGHAKIPAG
jgi:two-component system cell cycle response regulator DivK